jgi:hypothetical protein
MTSSCFERDSFISRYYDFPRFHPGLVVLVPGSCVVLVCRRREPNGFPNSVESVDLEMGTYLNDVPGVILEWDSM